MDRFECLGRSARAANLGAAVGPLDPRQQPLDDAVDDRHGLFAGEPTISGDRRVETERKADIEADVVLVGLAPARDGLLAVDGLRFPRVHEPGIAVESGIRPGGRRGPRAEPQDRPGGVRIGHDERRERERLDVPHHVAAVEVVARPVGEPEHARSIAAWDDPRR